MLDHEECQEASRLTHNRQIVDRAGIFKIQSVHVLPNTLKPTTLYSMPILFLESPVVRSPILLVNHTVLEIYSG